MGECAVARGAPAERVRVIPIGIDPAEIGAEAVPARAACSFMPEGVLRLLYVGSLWSVKGADVLLRAAALLGRASPAAMHSTVTLVGDGALRDDLSRLAAALGISDRVEFRGKVPRESMAGVFAQADVLCVPSRSEAFSVATLEGMWCGLPVVGSRTGGLPALIEDGTTGYLSTPGDPSSLAECLLKAATSCEHLADLGARGLAKARNGFGWPDIARRLAALAEEAAALAPLGGGER